MKERKKCFLKDFVLLWAEKCALWRFSKLLFYSTAFKTVSSHASLHTILWETLLNAVLLVRNIKSFYLRQNSFIDGCSYYRFYCARQVKGLHRSKFPGQDPDRTKQKYFWPGTYKSSAWAWPIQKIYWLSPAPY